MQSCENREKVVLYDPNSSTKEQYDPSIPITILSNSIIKTQYKDSVYPICFEAAFMDSTIVKEVTERGESTYTFETKTIGKIKIESGEIIACDPSLMYHGKPFTDKFPKGNFDVQLAIAKIPGNNNRVAFSRILFSDKPVSKWVYATREGERRIPINDSTLYCFSVDAGLAVYIDKIGRDVFDKYDMKEWQKVFVNGMNRKENSHGYIHNFETHNLAAISTGYGDGCYGSFIGLDSKGEICRLVSDLGILMWWKK
jgi:hypothetical protein